MDQVSGMATFSLAELAEMDGGRVSIVFAQELARCVRDIEDRPADSNGRVLNLKLSIKPDADDNQGLLDGAKIRVEVSSSLPKFKTKQYDFGVREGKLRFSKIDPENHNVRALPGMVDDDAEECER